MKPILQKSLLVAVLGLITTIVLIPTLKNGWTSWDDKVYILDNPLVKSLTKESVTAIFTTPQYNGGYTPLPMLSWAFNYHFSGTNVFPYHLTNLILHLINTVLCFVFVQLLTRNFSVAFATSILFGIHPMHLEPVAWITGRKDLLLGLFSLASLICWAKYDTQEQNRFSNYWLTLVFTILALLSKGTAVVLPVWFLLISVLVNQRYLMKSFFTLAPFWILAVAVGLLAVFTQQDSEAMQRFSEINFGHSSLAAINSLGTYIVKLVVPYHVGPAHNYPQAYNVFIVVCFFLVCAAFLAILWFVHKSRKHRKVFFGLLFFLIGVLPILQFLPVGYALTADRYVYIPYIGGFLVIGFVLSQLTNRNMITKTFVYVGFALYVSVLGFQTWSYANIWKSDLTLWNHEIAFHKYAPRAYVNRGHFYANNGMTQLALNDYNTAISQDPELKEAYQKIGLALQELKRYQEAEASFVKALEIDSLYSPAMLNLALNAFHQGDYESSFRYFNQAEKAEPKNLLVYLNRGVLYQQLGNYQAALHNFSTAIQVAPFNIRGYRFRGVLLFELGRMQEAFYDFEKWQELNTKDPMAYRWLARWYSQNRDEQRFIQNAELAKQLSGAFSEREFQQLREAAMGYSSTQSER